MAYKLPKTIYEYVKQEENAMSRPISLVDGGEWNFAEHVRLTTLFKNSMYSDGTGSITSLKESNRPFKNILQPILNMQYRSEGFDVKDIELYVDDPDLYWMSMLIRKYHDKWATDNEIDTFIDDMVECYVDYGGALIKDINDIKPEVVPLQSIAFCDQTNFMAGPIGLKHFYSPEELLATADMGWGEPANGATATLDEVITLACTEKESAKGQENKTPGKTIKVYEIQGMLPASYLTGGSYNDYDERYVRQTQIVCFYEAKSGNKEGITLFVKKRKDTPFKQVLRHKIYGRCLGRGGVEELFQAQIWTNYSEIRKKDMLDAASKVIIKHTDPSLKGRNNIKEMDNLDLLELSEGTDASQLDTTPRSMELFEKAVDDWFETAQLIASAQDATLGLTPASGTPLGTTQLTTTEDHSIHDYRRGKLSTFLTTVYRTWIIPGLVKSAAQGQTFLADLSLDELQQVAQAVADNQANAKVKQAILDGRVITADEVETFKQLTAATFVKKGGQRFMQTAKGEFAEAPVSVKINIAGKQAYTAQQVSALTNIFRQILLAPQILDDPRMAKIFNRILEASNLDPMDFTAPPSQPGTPQGTPSNMSSLPIPGLLPVGLEKQDVRAAIA